MALKEIFAEFDPAFRQSDIAAIAQQHAKADIPTNPIADVSPRIAPAEANAISTQMFNACVFPAYNAAATSAVSPGTGTPMLSRAMTKVTPQYAYVSRVIMSSSLAKCSLGKDWS